MNETGLLDVICIGNLNYDITFFTDAWPEDREKLRCDRVYLGFGGMAGNTSFWLSKLGINAGMVGCLGNDLPGRMHLRELKELGVNTSNIRVSDVHSGIAVIISKGDCKRIIKSPGANAHITLDKEYLSKAGHVHLAGGGKEIAEEVIRFCRERNRTVSYDPGGEPLAGCIEEVDYLILNEGELKRYVNQGSWKKAIKLLHPKHLIMTKNQGGCVVRCGSDVLDIGDFGVEAVDTTGSGDAFDAGFIYGLLRKKSIEECALCGVAAASINVQHVGARSGSMDTSSMEEMIEGKKGGRLVRRLEL